jgi:pilus assembly protein Flp/PilA
MAALDGSTSGATMAKFIRQFLAREDGPTAVEYAVMLALIVGACIASVNVLANAAGDSFDDSSTHLQSVLGS